MSIGFILLFIAWAVSICYNIFLLWYIQKNIWKKENKEECKI